jgi:hypothetical protein
MDFNQRLDALEVWVEAQLREHQEQRLDSLEAWVEAQLRENQDQKPDQGQHPQHGGGRGYQQVQQQSRLPQPVTVPKVDQDAFRRAMDQALHGVDPQVHRKIQQGIQQGFQQYQAQGQQKGRQLYYDVAYQALHGLDSQERQQVQQGMQQYIQQRQAPGQQQGQQLYYDVHNQQAHQQQGQQQQAQQQQAHRQQPPPQRHQQQHQPQAQTQPRLDQPQSEQNQKKGPISFSTTKADYVIITRVADSPEGTVSLARSTSRGSSPSTKELRVVKSIRGNGLIPREAHMLCAAGSHPNILRIFESAYNQLWGLAHMCMEFCSGGDLYELQCYYGTQHMHVPRAILFQAIINVSDGLAFLHGGWVRDEKTGFYEKKTANADHIVHRDLVWNAKETPFYGCQHANIIYRKQRTFS